MLERALSTRAGRDGSRRRRNCATGSKICLVDTDRRELRCGARVVSIAPQVLVHLIRNRERVVSQDDLLAAFWKGRIVSESTLRSHINAARGAVGDNGEDQQLIRT